MGWGDVFATAGCRVCTTQLRQDMGLDYWKVLGVHESGWRVHLSFGARGLDGEGEMFSQPPAAGYVPLN